MSIFASLVSKNNVSTPVIAGVSLEAIQAEMEAIDAERQVLNTEINFFGAQTTSLEGIAERLEASLETGGLNTQAAEFMQEHADSITQSMGLEQSVVASMESFGPASDREEATKASMEGIKQMAKDAWTAIIEMIKKAITKVKAFFASVFDAGSKLEKRAKAMVERAKDLTGSPTEKNIKLGSLTKTLAKTGGKVVDAAAVVAEAKAFEKGEDLKKNYFGIDGKGELRNLAEEFSAGDVSNIAESAYVTRIATSYGKLIAPLTTTGDTRYTQDKVLVKPFALGNQAVVTTMGSTTETSNIKALCDAMGKLSVRVDLATKDFKHPANDVESKVLEISQISDIAESLAICGNALAKDRKEHEAAINLQDKIVKSLEKVKGGAAKIDSDKKDLKPTLSAYASAAGAIAKSISDVNANNAKYMVSTAIAMLSYCEQSASQYKKA